MSQAPKCSVTNMILLMGKFMAAQVKRPESLHGLELMTDPPRKHMAVIAHYKWVADTLHPTLRKA